MRKKLNRTRVIILIVAALTGLTIAILTSDCDHKRPVVDRRATKNEIRALYASIERSNISPLLGHNIVIEVSSQANGAVLVSYNLVNEEQRDNNEHVSTICLSSDLLSDGDIKNIGFGTFAQRTGETNRDFTCRRGFLGIIKYWLDSSKMGTVEEITFPAPDSPGDFLWTVTDRRRKPGGHTGYSCSDGVHVSIRGGA